jgi:very-short-patch-repair endonuclease
MRSKEQQERLERWMEFELPSRYAKLRKEEKRHLENWKSFFLQEAKSLGFHEETLPRETLLGVIAETAFLNRARLHNLAEWACLSNRCENPVEEMLLSAFQIIDLDLHYSFWPLVEPQFKIGAYRVDFLLHAREDLAPEHCVIVECDGLEFHERNQEQFKYEKQRDRWLNQQGYRIFHYAAVEVMDDPLKVAAEVMEIVIKRAGIKKTKRLI